MGRVFPLRDYLALANILLEVCKDNFPFEDYFSKIIDYAENYYNWETNIKKIHALLFGLS
ncbi:hypothetical protein AGMMS49938_18470 [Fibrobacterales bacterium]|nr:hypothetical protein AGMMS49938_18470 [Fibrobacterales bacterium]